MNAYEHYRPVFEQAYSVLGLSDDAALAHDRLCYQLLANKATATAGQIRSLLVQLGTIARRRLPESLSRLQELYEGGDVEDALGRAQSPFSKEPGPPLGPPTPHVAPPYRIPRGRPPRGMRYVTHINTHWLDPYECDFCGVRPQALYRLGGKPRVFCRPCGMRRYRVYATDLICV